MSADIIFTSEATATSDGRIGQVLSPDGYIDIPTAPPKGAGGSGAGTNPEQLLAAGWGSCFLGALWWVAREQKIALDPATAVTVRVGFGKDPAGGFGLNAAIDATLPGLDQESADQLLRAADRECPFSKSMRHNIDVALSAHP